MFDERFFADKYDLYRPTISTSAGGVQSVTEPNNATLSGKPCKFFSRVGATQPVGVAQRGYGPDFEFDAVMLTPIDADIRPAKKGEQPDHVALILQGETVAQTFVVIAVARNLNRYQRIYLLERR